MFSIGDIVKPIKKDSFHNNSMIPYLYKECKIITIDNSKAIVRFKDGHTLCYEPSSLELVLSKEEGDGMILLFEESYKRYKYEIISDVTEEEVLDKLNNWSDHFKCYSERVEFIKNNLKLKDQSSEFEETWL